MCALQIQHRKGKTCCTCNLLIFSAKIWTAERGVRDGGGRGADGTGGGGAETDGTAHGRYIKFRDARAELQSRLN